MMATYQSISNAVSEKYPPVSIPYGSPCVGTAEWSGGDAGPLPEAITRTYDPLTVTENVYDPTKGTRRNWLQIKKSGTISMTPYSRSRRTVEQFVVERPRRFRTWIWRVAWCGDKCTGKFVDLGTFDRYWTERDHIGSLSHIVNHDLTNQTYREFSEQVSDAIITTQQEAYADALSTYDLLTELAEARETLSYLASKVSGASEVLRKFASTDEATYRRARGLTAKQMLKSTDKALRRLGSRWMEYRYAIMPLVYSIKDINELLAKRDAVYKTSRSKQEIRSSFTERDGSYPEGGIYTYTTCELEAIVRSTVKLGYNRGALQRVISQSAFNPFKTAWELIPYSFVVDWFLNVGDVITSLTSIDLSSQRVCCTSVRRREVHEIWLRDKTSDTSSKSIAKTPCNEARSARFVFNRDINSVLQRTTVESYDRFLWTAPTPKLVFNPQLTWKRMVDALVLAYQPTRNLLRSL